MKWSRVMLEDGDRTLPSEATRATVDPQEYARERAGGPSRAGVLPLPEVEIAAVLERRADALGNAVSLSFAGRRAREAVKVGVLEVAITDADDVVAIEAVDENAQAVHAGLLSRSRGFRVIGVSGMRRLKTCPGAAVQGGDAADPASPYLDGGAAVRQEFDCPKSRRPKARDLDRGARMHRRCGDGGGEGGANGIRNE